MTDAAIRKFCQEQREWLALELESDQEQFEAATASGSAEVERSHVLHQLEAADVAVGLYGRTVVRLTPCDEAGKNLLPAHSFTTGDEVEIRSKTDKKDNSPGGVICEVTDSSISVALFSKKQQQQRNNKKQSKDDDGGDGEDDGPVGSPPLSLLPKSSIEVHRKLMTALEELERHGVNHPSAGRVVTALFEGDKAIAAPQPATTANANNKLDTSQLDAIAFCLTENRPVSLIHGPPGTGKTTTLAQLIQDAVRKHGYKVLVTAPSNVAVDNLLERLVAADSDNRPGRKSKKGSSSASSPKLKVVRLGHPARLQPGILKYSLEALVQQAEGTEIVADVRKELASYLKIISSSRSRPADKRLAYREIKTLRKEIRSREESVVKQLLSESQVVLATCVGAGNKLLVDAPFDLVVIDEAAQALEVACWIPTLRGSKLILAGDHLQLPPTIKSKDKKVERALSRTMFERIMELYGDTLSSSQEEKKSEKPGRVSRMLQVQYRMHQSISDWASNSLYGGRLQTHETVKDRTLLQLTGQHGSSSDDGDLDISETTMLLIDTAGCDWLEAVNESTGSRSNKGEAMIVAKHVRKLVGEMRVPQNEIAVITPYNGQVEVLRTMLLPEYPKLEIRSVDGFQGGEREAVVLSLVRSSPGGRGGIGFLSNDRRLNVAVTRAKRHCCVICDSDTVSKSTFIKNLLDWIEEHGEQLSALEYLSAESTSPDEVADLTAEMQHLAAVSAQNMRGSKPKPKKPPPPKQDPREDEHIKQLVAKIHEFAQNGKPGDTMPLSSELSKFERFVVHEEGEKLGIGHQSEGVEGVDRRIVLSKPQETAVAVKQCPTAATLAVSAEPEPEMDTGQADEKALADAREVATGSAFGVLGDEDDDEEEDVDNQAAEVNDAGGTATDPAEEHEESAPASMNSVLGDLAKARIERERQRQEQQQQATTSNKSTGKGKKKGQKLGGTKKPKLVKSAADETENELDDMAFLDSQIEKNMTAHGRKITGNGKNFRTVMNGVLTSKPPVTKEPQRDAKASANLQSKLKKAQNDRKAKGKKKK